MSYTVMNSWDGFQWIRRTRTDGLASTRWHEPFMLPLLESLVGPQSVFLDVGAHVGRYAVRMAKRARWVYAVEPDPSSIEGLMMNAELNGIHNITVLQLAASDSEGVLALSYEGRKFVARATRLDTVLPEPPTIALLDVEGAEEAALVGLERMAPPIMIIELHHLVYPGRVNLKSLLGRLTAMGYSGREVASFVLSRYLLATRA